MMFCGIVRFIAALSFISLMSCSGSDSAGGSTSDVPNAIAVTLIHGDGSKAAHVAYYVRPADYLSDSNAMAAPTGYTDSLGRVEIELDSTIEQWVEFYTPGSGFLLRCLPDQSCASDSILQLAPWARVSSVVLNSEGIVQSGVLVRISGLERMTITDTNGRFFFEDLPAGVLTVMVDSIATNFEIEAGSNIQLPVQILPVHPEISVDTIVLDLNGLSAISENLSDFPLALKKSLLADSLDIERIHFISPTGQKLKHNESRQGVIHVLVDTIYANVKNVIYMVTKPEKDPANLGSVFTMSNGYAGVWHLQNPNNGVFPNQVSSDFSCNFSGAWPDTQYQESPHGIALVFPGGTARLDCGLLDLDTFATVQGWVRIDQFNENARIVIKADTLDSTTTYNSYAINLQTDTGSIHFSYDVTNGDGNLVTPQAYTLGKWVYLSMVYNGSSIRSYVDGVLTESRNQVSGVLRKSDAPLSFGGSTRYVSRTLIGAMDEVRISRVARSSSWIALEARLSELVNYRPSGN